MKKSQHTTKKSIDKKHKSTTYGLALSGGAALGAYQAGAIKALRERGLDIRVVAGSSIGALNGYLAATGDIELLISLWSDMDKKKLITINSFAKLFFSPSESLLKDDNQRKIVETHVRLKDLEACGVEFIASTISLNTGKLHYFSHKEARSDKDLHNFILASSAIPGVFPPIKIGHELFMDGGLIRNTPIEIIAHKKIDRIIAISMEPENYPHEPVNSAGQIALRTLSIFFRAQAEDAVALHKTLSKQKKIPKLFLLRPKKTLPMQQFEFEPKKIHALLEQGYKEARDFIHKEHLA